jgi:hypothetical protein
MDKPKKTIIEQPEIVSLLAIQFLTLLERVVLSQSCRRFQTLARSPRSWPREPKLDYRWMPMYGLPPPIKLGASWGCKNVVDFEGNNVRSAYSRQAAELWTKSLCRFAVPDWNHLDSIWLSKSVNLQELSIYSMTFEDDSIFMAVRTLPSLKKLKVPLKWHSSFRNAFEGLRSYWVLKS